MKVYLVRHGEAATDEVDARHPLSDKGKLDMERVGQFLASLNLNPTHFFHSEKLRAIQTAEILSKTIHFKGELEIRSELDPLSLVSPIASEINQAENDMIYVGHMPFMSKLASKLITGDEASDVIAFQTGTVVCLEKSVGSYWAVRWVVNPELFISS